MATSSVPFFQSFIRSQFASIIATLVDMTSLYLLTELIDVYYVYSTGIGSAMGAVVSFLLGRYWAFKVIDKSFYLQALRYALASLLILVLNMIGVYYLTDSANMYYMWSKVTISIVVGVFVSFPLFRYFVYK